MDYKIIWHEDAKDDLKKLPKDIARKIINRVEQYLIKAPLSAGKTLKGFFSGLYRYRHGDYRIIYAVDADKIIILKVGHRKNVYVWVFKIKAHFNLSYCKNF